MRTISVLLAATTLVTLVLFGCGKDEKGKGAAGALPSSNLPEKFWLKSTPSGVKPVSEVREKAKDGDQVVVAGVVGGRKEPFIDGAAAFTIVDGALVKCTEDHCPAPWDYCCEPLENLRKNMVTVEFREGPSPIRSSARGFHGLDYLKNVVVAGEAKRDEAGNVVVVASGIFIEP